MCFKRQVLDTVNFIYFVSYIKLNLQLDKYIEKGGNLLYSIDSNCSECSLFHKHN